MSTLCGRVTRVQYLQICVVCSSGRAAPAHFGAERARAESPHCWEEGNGGNQSIPVCVVRIAPFSLKII